eukprot:TRINITY_DN93209_c0_g1_i1.p1 TRINITY_DN93209_c0_g1~~TRINITY_DN93209_c0_g1_i1.p1  ORF type:complete len:476 (+),score=92.83 TRINITY_DN93209_c0_g1_i1:51-1478(+)
MAREGSRLRRTASDCSEDIPISALKSQAGLPSSQPTFIPERKAFRHPKRPRGIAVLEAPGYADDKKATGQGGIGAGSGEGELGVTKRSTKRLKERPSKEEEREPDIESVIGRLPPGFAEDYFSSPTCAKLERSGVLSLLMERVPTQAAPRALSASEILSERKTRWLQRLQLGFSLLVEGLGSKRDLLETFAKQGLVPWGADVACFDAFDARGSLLGFLRELFHAHPSLQDKKGGCSVEGIAATIASARQLPATVQPPLVLVVHNLEALSMQHLGALASLVAAPGVRLVASVDHCFARAVWTCDLIKDFNFVREIVNTMQGYEVELKGKYPEGPPHWCDPSADRHQESKVSIGLVLRSLTNNHRELCEAMAKNQLTVGGKEGISTSDLLALAEDRMIASSITKLRSLLNELSDHEVVAQRSGADGGTLYWIPWKERILQKLANGETPDDADIDEDPDDEADENDDEDGEESGAEDE